MNQPWIYMCSPSWSPLPPWGIVASQCCASFCHAAKWISHMYAYIPSVLDFLPIWVTTEHWGEFPLLYSRFSLVIYFIYSINRVYMSIPVPQFIPHSSLSPLGIHMFILYVCVSISSLQMCSSVPSSRSHTHVLIYNICFSLSDLLHSVWQSLGHPCLCK